MIKHGFTDYAYAYMQAKKALDAAYQAMLKKDLDNAAQLGLRALAETKLMVNAIKDQNNALR